MSDAAPTPIPFRDPGDGSSARQWTIPENWDGDSYIGPGLPPWGTRPRCPVSRNGRRCRKACIPGGTVCNTHGGAAPQVRNRAKLRLLSLVDPALSTLARTLATSADEKLKTQISFGILDRTGLGKASDVSADVAKAVLMERYRTLRNNLEEEREALGLPSLDEEWSALTSDAVGVPAAAAAALDDDADPDPSLIDPDLPESDQIPELVNPDDDDTDEGDTP